MKIVVPLVIAKDLAAWMLARKAKNGTIEEEELRVRTSDLISSVNSSGTGVIPPLID